LVGLEGMEEGQGKLSLGKQSEVRRLLSMADVILQRQYILRYEDLDNGATRNGSALNQMALSAAPSALAQAAGVFSR
jgi:hypothetical protein